MRAYFNFWRNCLNFSGRTSRRDFWVSGIMFNLFGFLINLTEGIILAVKYGVPAEMASRGPVFTIYGCIGLIPFISMLVRRLRDGGYWDKSAWKFLIPIVGFVRLIWCIYIEESASEDNCVS